MRKPVSQNQSLAKQINTENKNTTQQRNKTSKVKCKNNNYEVNKYKKIIDNGGIYHSDRKSTSVQTASNTPKKGFSLWLIS